MTLGSSSTNMATALLFLVFVCCTLAMLIEYKLGSGGGDTGR